MPKIFKILPIFLSILFFTSCSIVDSYALKRGYEKKEIAELKVEKIKQESAAELEKKTREIELAKDGLIAQIKKNFESATGWTYGAFIASELVENKDRLDNIINLRLKTALSYSPSISPEVIAEQNRLLREELDTVKVSNEELKKRYAEKEKEAIVARAAEKEKENALQKAKDEKIALEKTYNEKLQAAYADLAEKQDKIIGLEKSRADDAKARHAAMMKLSIGAGIISLLCFAGAIYLPIGKHGLIILGAVTAIGSVGVWYIKGWMILLFVGLCFLAIIGYFLLKHRKDEKLSDALVLGLQDIKNTSSEKWKNEVMPFIKERLKKYVKKDGKIVTEDDLSLEKHIDQKLADWDAK